MPRPPASPPRPASFAFTAGFDFPAASTSPSRASSSRDERSISRALRSLDRPERTSPAVHDEAAATPPVPRRMLRATRRGHIHRMFGPPRDGDTTDSLSRRPPTANPNRPRATPSERYLRRSQARIREQRADMESAADTLDSLSDVPITSAFALSRAARAPSPTVEVSSERRQTKRRKLEHSAAAKSEYDGFKYGYRGQVVPGRLRMEIVSCDGGEYYERENPSLYKVQNVLKNDKSVYCSQSSRCNLLLKHIGEAPFSLEKVVIRAPDRGFTAPVQEGLVFVSMTQDELIASTSAYNLEYHTRSPMLSPSPDPPDEDEQTSLMEAFEDPDVWEQSRQGTQEEIETRIQNLRLRTARLNRESERRLERDRRRSQGRAATVENDVYLENCIAEDSQAGLARLSAPTPPPFTVTTASADDSDSNEELPSAAVMADRLRREGRWPAESDEEDMIPRMSGPRRAPALDYTFGESRDRRERPEPMRASQVGAPSRLEPSEPPSEADTLIPPHARFFIAKNKSKITIKFHPALSGRNVLLKLWSPTHDGNIDIESVQFYGFSGPRFFPATQLC